VIYFLALGTLLAFAPRPTAAAADRERFGAVVKGATLLGLIASVALAALAVLAIGGLCLGCALVYGVTLVHAALAAEGGATAYLAGAIASGPAAWGGLKEMFAPEGDVWRPSRGRAALLWLALFVAPVNFFIPPFLIRRALNRPIIQQFFEKPVVELKIGPRALAYGPPEAPLQVVMFTDFACPYCRSYHATFEQAIAPLAGQIRVIYKHFPLQSQCNPIMGGPSARDHANACLLARLAQAAGELGKFNELRGDFYQLRGSDLSPEARALAERAGLDYAAWAARSNDPRIVAQVDDDIREGNAIGLRAVPTLFINGRAVDSLKPEDVELLLRASLARRGE